MYYNQKCNYYRVRFYIVFFYIVFSRFSSYFYRRRSARVAPMVGDGLWTSRRVFSTTTIDSRYRVSTISFSQLNFNHLGSCTTSYVFISSYFFRLYLFFETKDFSYKSEKVQIFRYVLFNNFSLQFLPLVNLFRLKDNYMKKWYYFLLLVLMCNFINHIWRPAR